MSLPPDTPTEKSVNNRASQATPHKENESGRDLPSLSTQIPPSPPATEKPCKCCHHKTPGWKVVLDIGMLVATSGAFAAAAYYAHIAAGQLTAMGKTYEEIQKQTTFQRHQTVGSYAAAIPKATPWPRANINDLELLNYTGIGLTYVNVGKIKATNFIAEATLIRKTLPNYKPFGRTQHEQISKAEMKPAEQTSPQGSGDTRKLDSTLRCSLITT